jgi:serine/threonine protein kinase
MADEVSKDRIPEVRPPLPFCTTLAQTRCTTASQILLRDYHARKQLQHENILPLLGFSYEFGPLPAMVSPWMHNSSLTTYLGRNFAELTSRRKFQIVCYFSTENAYVIHRNLSYSKWLPQSDTVRGFFTRPAQPLRSNIAVHSNDVVHGDLTAVRS